MPNSTRKQFVVDYWRSQGSHIDETKKDVLEISDYIRKIPGVTNACSCIGAGTLRFMLTYNGAGPSGGYGQIIVDVEEARSAERGLIKAKLSKSQLSWLFLLCCKCYVGSCPKASP